MPTDAIQAYAPVAGTNHAHASLAAAPATPSL